MIARRVLSKVGAVGINVGVGMLCLATAFDRSLDLFPILRLMLGVFGFICMAIAAFFSIVEM